MIVSNHPLHKVLCIPHAHGDDGHLNESRRVEKRRWRIFDEHTRPAHDDWEENSGRTNPDIQNRVPALLGHRYNIGVLHGKQEGIVDTARKTAGEKVVDVDHGTENFVVHKTQRREKSGHDSVV